MGIPSAQRRMPLNIAPPPKSNSSKQEQNDEDQQDDADQAGRTVAPGPGMWPCRNHAYESQDENDDQNCGKGHRIFS